MKHHLILLVLLLPLLLIPQAQGIRLGKVRENSIDKGLGELPVDARKIRKLLVAAATTNTATSVTNQKAHDQKTEKSEASKGNAKEGFSVKSSTTAFERYPDIIDIAGMDYSPAKRKPPIHN